ncbi:hypothetical protein [Caulobacter sp. LjRoot300]|uniref:hypothetical protein n=1 Tax=Caulobacter sp. LjRoot300 TaxID=3342321 RepID=UPI003ED0483B
MSDSLPNDVSLSMYAIGEPRNNDLRVVVMEAKPASEPVQAVLGLATPIRPDETCRAYEIVWSGYVAYNVRNESYFQAEPGEALGGPPLAVRTASAYLAHVRASTFATDDYPGVLTHWRLYLEWHCLDVVGVDPPEIRLMTADETVAILAEFS